ncbi:MAG: DUF5717 family protein [Lachnospiraceae bacterium]|nr:DUF5717 family protein [Lachnospiraceae bacterium]
MVSVVENILNGNFNTERHSLNFSSPVIELSVNEGQPYEGSFTVYGPRDVFTEGTVSSTGLRMKCPVGSFSGSECEIPFVFDSVGMNEGDSFKGEFRIISNQGEYLIPYDIKIGNDNLDTSMGEIRNLFHFTNLARSNWDEAANFFFSDDFKNVLVGSDKAFLNAYMALRDANDRHQALEEFLLKIKKKQPVEFIIEEPVVKIDSLIGSLDKNIMIKRNGWGYSDLEISTDESFIILLKDSITERDFTGNSARIPYKIDGGLLHEGRNYGTIFLKNAYNSIEINVCINNHPINRRIAEMERTVKHHMIDLMRYYEAFRCRKISAGTWMQETGNIVDTLRELDKDNTLYELMNVQLLATRERYNEARWILEQTENTVATSDDPTLYCYYYYLTTLVNRADADTDKVASLVRHMYHKNPGNWKIAWLLMYLEEDYARSGQKKWELINKLYDLGAASPVLYVEAFVILQNNPTILSKLGDFEIQLLRYMAKKDILTPDVIEQFVYMFERLKVYKEPLVDVLKACYRVLPNNEVLKALCMLLINLGDTSRESFAWYEKAIENELKITKLYEYYMMSIDMDTDVKIPKMALMYFAFDSSLDSVHNAYLYSYMYRNRNILTELYDNYKEAIERFVFAELHKGNNNRFLAYLYKNIVTESSINEDTAKGLSKAIFVHRITFSRDDITKVRVRYSNIDTDNVYPVRKGEKEIYIPIYGSNNQIVLYDSKGNSFICESEYEIQRLMMPDKLQGLIAPYIKSDVLFDLWACEHGSDLAAINNGNVVNMRRIADCPIADRDVRKEIKGHLIRYYYDEDMMDELDSLLDGIGYDEVPAKGYSEVIHLMVLRGMYEKAYDWICASGGDNIEAKVIAKLCRRLLDETLIKDEEDPSMTALIHRAFTVGRCDETLLKYLVRFFKGTCREMKEIWKAARGEGIEVFKLEERLLEQLLYTGAYVSELGKILSSYNESFRFDNLTLAVLSQIGYDYFVYDKLMDDECIKLIADFISADREMPFVLKLTYTKLNAEKASELSDNELRTIVMYLRQIMAQGMFFPYFKDYASTITFMHRFLDKTIIEYRAPGADSAVIHYMTEKNESNHNEYSKEDMKNMYHGIFVKQFVLFFGERLQYYIVEKKGDEEQLTESGTVTCSDMDHQNSASKYGMINDIAIARTLGDYDTMEKLLEEYFRHEYLLSELFRMSE